MKSVIQVVALIAAIFGGIFLVTFLAQYTRKPAESTEPKPDGGPKANAELLKRWERTAVWDPEDPNYTREIEKGTQGYYDFLIANVSETPVKLTLNSKSCKCASVRYALLSAPIRAKLKDATKEPPSGTRLEPFVADASWTELLRERDQPNMSITVPPADAAGPQFAVLRLGWDGKKEPQKMILSADLQATAGSAADYLHFEVPIIICPPVGASTEKLDFGELKPGERQTQTLILWSATRDKFDVTAQLAAPDPCIVVAPPRPLTADELKKLPEEMVAKGLVQAKTRPKCGYEISVTAAERQGDNQLELGAMSRRLMINGTDWDVTVSLVGTVRGAIKVGEPSDHDRIELRVFPANRGIERMVKITSPDPNLQLTLDHVKPDGLKASIVPNPAGFGTRTWKLTVTAPPNALAGPLPPDSAIYLKTNSTPPRRVRIPISGNASG
jgi:hypothetical protein